MTATAGRPTPRPSATIAWASACADRPSFMKAPEPALTSSTTASAPVAIFLLITELAINGIDSTVAVTSRSAYRRPSPGTSSGDCAATASPRSRTAATNASGSVDVVTPGIASSLSIVPPVWPSPRPDILATAAPAAASIGASASVVLSPTPPVLCLSTTGRSNPWKLSRRPLSASASVRARVSPSSSPRQHTAINQAAIW